MTDAKKKEEYINWTPEKFVSFKLAYERASSDGDDTFNFEGHLFVRCYAKYLIEYLDDQFKRNPTT